MGYDDEWIVEQWWNVVPYAETLCNVRAKTTYSGHIGMCNTFKKWVGGVREMHYHCASLRD
jgi:hypothetical protein